MLTTDVGYIEARADLLSVTADFPPPGVQRLGDLLQGLQALAGDATGLLSFETMLRNDSAIADYEHRRRLGALLELARFELDPTVAQRLRSQTAIEEHWPACWAGLVVIARHNTVPIPDRLTLLRLASERAPIGSRDLIEALQKLLTPRQADGHPLSHSDRQDVYALLSHHNPTLSQLAWWMSTAIKDLDLWQIQSAAERVIAHIRLVHGEDPREWVVSSAADLFTAGRICMHMTRVFLSANRWKDVQRHARAAVDFFRQSIVESNKPTPLMFSYLAEALVQWARSRIDRSQLPDADLPDRLDEADEAARTAANDSRDYVERAGRVLAFTSAARFKLTSPGYRDTHLKQVQQRFEQLIDSLKNKPGLRAAATHQYAEFLTEVLGVRAGIACELEFAGVSFSVTLIENIKRGGRDQECLRLLLRGDNTGHPSSLIAIGFILQEARRRHARLASRHEAAAVALLEESVAALMNWTRDALQADLNHRAERCIEALAVVQPEEPRVLHLLSTVLEAADRPYDLKALFTPARAMSDAYMRGRFATILRTYPPVFHDADPAFAWTVATAPGKSGTVDAYTVSDVLAWQIATERLDDFDARVLWSARAFPLDRYVASVPAWLSFQHGPKVDDVLKRIWRGGLSEEATAQWLIGAFETAPGDFFARDANCVELLEDVARCSGIVDSATRRQLEFTACQGLVRAAIGRWSNPAECRARVDAAARVLADLPNPRGLRHWTTWFGSGRTHFFELVAEQMSGDLDALEVDLDREPPASHGWWLDRLEEFLRRYRSAEPTSAIRQDQAALAIIGLVRLYERRFSPLRLQKDYYRDVMQAVRRWRDATEPSRLVESAGELWFELHRHLEADARRMIGDIAWHRLHTAKNALEFAGGVDPEAPISDAWRTSLRSTLRRTRRFLAHYRTPLQTQPLDLREVARKAGSSMVFGLGAAGHAGADIYTDVPETPIHVVGDAAHLLALAQNLVQNARAATARDPRHRYIVIKAAADGEVASLTVRDNGDGLDSLELARLNRVEHSGTGFGLSLCKRIALLHAGRFELSDAQPGIRATLFLPLASPAKVVR